MGDTLAEKAYLQSKENSLQLADIASQGVSVKSHGAIGDGITDDTDAIELALADALTKDKILYFPIGTYLMKRGIILRSGMQIIGAKGAILTKKPAVTQLVQQNVVAGDNFVYVQDASKYEVGQCFYLFNDNGDSPYNATVGKITAIDIAINKITFEAYKSNGAVRNHPVSATTVFSNTFSMITTNSTKYDADNILIDGITLNPNSQVDEPNGYVLAPIHIDFQNTEHIPGGVQKNNVIRNNIILNSPSDGISVQSEGNCFIERNRVYNCKQKGIHVGTTIYNITVRDNIIEDCPNDCAIYWCYNVYKMIVTNNFIKNCYRGCDGIDGMGNDGVIAFNVFEQISNYAINMYGANRYIVYGNIFRDMTTTINNSVIIINNGSRNNIVSNNLISGANGVTGKAIEVEKSDSILISDNHIIGFNNNDAIRVNQYSGVQSSNIRISGNVISGKIPINLVSAKNIIISENKVTPLTGNAPINISSSCQDIWLNNNIVDGDIVNNGIRVRIDGISHENTGGSKPSESYYKQGNIVEDTSTKDLYVLAGGGLEWLKLTATIIDILTYVCKNGIENILMVEATNTGVGTIASKETTHLYLEANNPDGNASIGYVTDTPLDLTSISSLYVNWENIGDTSNYNNSYIGIAATKTGASVLSINLKQNFVRQTSILDVSSLTGSYSYIMTTS